MKIFAVLSLMATVFSFTTTGALASPGPTQDYSFDLAPKKHMILVLSVEAVCEGGNNQFVIDHSDSPLNTPKPKKKGTLPSVKWVHYSVDFTSDCANPVPGKLKQELPIEGDLNQKIHLTVTAAASVKVTRKE